MPKSSRRSSLHIPRIPQCLQFTHLFTSAIFKSSKITFAIAIAIISIIVTDNVQPQYIPCLQAILTISILHLLWNSLLLALKEFQNVLLLPSELEERLLTFVLEHLQHLHSWWTRIEDVSIILFISCSTFIPSWLYIVTLCTIKLFVGLRLVTFIWSLLDIVSQTAWLETKLCQQNKISKAQTELFMRSLSKPFKGLFMLIVMNDIASTAGLNTTPLFYSLVVGAGVLGASAQSIVIDFVASIHIMVARPFQSGDAISVGNDPQVMEVRDVSYKYTRLRAMDGHLMVYPNHLIANTSLTNFGSLVHRRRIFSQWKISRKTSSKILKEIPNIIEQCILNDVQVDDLVVVANKDKDTKTKELRSMVTTTADPTASTIIDTSDIEFFCGWLTTINATCYNIEVGYILVDIPNFREAQHRVNIQLIDAFEKNNIELTSFVNINENQIAAAAVVGEEL